MNADFRDFEHRELTDKIIKIFCKVHSKLGYGFLEKVHGNALLLEVEKENISAVRESAITVFYDEKIIGEFFADVLVENKVIVEIRAGRQLVEEEVRRKAFDDSRK